MSKVVVLAVLAVVALLALVRYGRRSAARPGTTARLRAPVGSPEADAQTLRALRDAGADLAKPTEVHYYLYFPTRAAAERAAAAARTPEVATAVREGAEGTTWLCLATAHMVPSDSAIRAATTRLQALAESLGGTYDGWEAAVTQ